MAGRAGHQDEIYLRKFLPVSGEDRRQANAGGGFERADSKTAAGSLAVAHNICRVVQQLYHLDSIGQQLLARRRKNDTAAVATKEMNPKLVLKQTYPSRNVRLNGM